MTSGLRGIAMSGMRERAAKQGVRLTITWDTLGQNEGEVYERLASIPRDPAVWALADTARILEEGGADADQRGLVERMLMPCVLRNRVLRRMGEGYVFASPAAVQSHAPSSGYRRLKEESRAWIYFPMNSRCIPMGTSWRIKMLAISDGSRRRVHLLSCHVERQIPT
jgi:hypothetical protein